MSTDYVRALEAVAEAARDFRAVHPGWSPDSFDEHNILEALQGGESPGVRLDAALESLDQVPRLRNA